MIQKLLQEITSAGIHLFVDSGKLKARAVNGVISDEIKECISKNKQALIELLSDTQRSDESVNTIMPLDKGECLVRASYAQERLWLTEQISFDTYHYNIHGVFRVGKQFDVEIAESAFIKIIMRHESLRTSVFYGSDTVMQRVNEETYFAIDIKNIAVHGNSSRNLLNQYLIEHSRKHFELSSNNMLSVILVICGAERYLSICMPHIASDGWSEAILINEFVEFYNAIIERREPNISPLSIQYRDYSVWQREWMDSDVCDEQLSYWKDKLSDIPISHALPLDFDRNVNKIRTGKTLIKYIDERLTSAIKRLGHEVGITDFMVFHSMFCLLISRYSNSNDIVLGTPVSNRLNLQIEPLIGFFVNTLVLRVCCNENITVRDFLNHVRDVNIEAQQNQLIPFNLLVDKLQVQRISGITPLFQILLSMDTNEQVDEINLAGEELEYIQIEDTTVKYDMTCTIAEQGGKFVIRMNYDSGLFRDETINLFNDGYVALLESLVENYDGNLVDFGLLNDSHCSDYYIKSNQNGSKQNKFLAIHDQFAQLAAQFPDLIAFSDSKQFISYAESNRCANKLAHYLLEHGIGRDSMVGLCCERNCETFIGMLAILKTGAAYVPFQENMPINRLEYIIQDTDMKFVLCSANKSTTLSSLISCVVVDGQCFFDDGLREYSSQNPALNYNLNDALCYVIYTSGSTGDPKGVMVEHKSISHYVNEIQKKLKFSNKLQYAALSTISTDLGNTTIFLSMATGGTLHIAPSEIVFDCNSFLSFIQTKNIQVIKLTPSHLGALMVNDDKFDALFSQCNIVFLGGELFNSELRKRIDKFCNNTDCRIINHYGPTETTIGCSIYEVTNCNDALITPIGTPIGDVVFQLRDRYGRQVPMGVSGELYVSGSGLARGYLNNSQMTDEKFQILSDEYGNLVRWYKTGDWVKLNLQRELVYIGRMDNQLKIRGFRVELGEIEQAILCHFKINSVLVVLEQNLEVQHQRLIAYFKLKDMFDGLDHNELAEYLSLKLPMYMIPDCWVEIEYWPLTDNGKVNRKALPLPSARVEKEIEHVCSDRECEVRKIWSTLLEVEENFISKQSNFFQLGGHSLVAIRLVSLVADKYQIEVSIRDIFNYPSLHLFAKFTEQANKHTQPTEILRVNSDRKYFPLSYGQQLIWFIGQLEQSSSHYNMLSVLSVEGDFDIDAANRSLCEIIKRHEILRTVYVSEEGIVQQYILDNYKFEIDVIDLNCLLYPAQTEEIQSLIKVGTKKEFDLENDLPICVQFIKQSEQRGKLLVNMHHIASDGWSVRILTEEFSYFYSAFIKNAGQIEFNKLDVRYADFAVWQKDECRNEKFTFQLNYWCDQLSQLPEVHSLPIKGSRIKNRTYQGSGVSRILEQEVVSKLKQLANCSNATFFMVLHAAFSILLSRYANTDDVVIGTPVANRTQKSLESLIGFFVNTLVLRTKVQKDVTFCEFLEHVREVNLMAQANQDVPFELIVERLNPNRSVQTSPLFQILFTLDEEVGENLSLPSVTLIPEFQEESFSKFELTVDVTALQEGYFFNFQYNTDLFSSDVIQSMASDFMRLLGSISQSPDFQLSRLNQLSIESKNWLTTNSGGGSKLPENISIDGLNYFDDCIVHYAVQSPDAYAIQQDGEKITYFQLNQKINYMAQYLLAEGVQVGDVVCVLLTPSIDLLTNILAVMRVGGIYLATDIQWPFERVKTLLEKSDAAWCLTYSEYNYLSDGNNLRVILLDTLCVKQKLMNISGQQVSVTRLSPNHQGAYLIYTSGSTGVPKGVLISQHALVSYAKAALQEYKIKNEDRVLQFSSVGFDIFIEELSITMLSGACLCIRKDSMIGGGRYFWDEVRAMEITVMSLPTSFWHQLVFELKQDIINVPSIKTVILGGERISNEAIKSWRKYFSNTVELYNTYGPTETTVVATLHQITEMDDLLQPVPIGRPLFNTRVAVIAPDGSLSPIGCIGELYIGGESLAIEYWHDKPLTEKYFIKDFSDSRDRFYRTGDLVQYNLDGELVFINRLDAQVKIRGYRIELGELEVQISKLKNIKTVVVTAPIAKNGERQLCAYVTLSGYEVVDADSASKSLRTRLVKMLPKYMIPDHVMVIDYLPLTVNGKVDYSKLPDIEVCRKNKEISFPVTDTQINLRNIWAKLLDLDVSKISICDEFFRVGGNSMLSVRLVILIQETLGVKITVHNVFTMQTIEQLAEFVDGKVGDGEGLLSCLSYKDKRAVNIFCIPGLLGTAAAFLELSNRLPDFNIYAFNYAGVLDDKEHHTSIEEIVAAFIAEILRYQNNGLFVILGHSFGAKIAYEIVRKLEQIGHNVTFVILDGELNMSNNDGRVSKAINSFLTTDIHTSKNEVPMTVDKIVGLFRLSIDYGELEKLQQKLLLINSVHTKLANSHRMSTKLNADVLAVYAEDNNATQIKKDSLTFGELVVVNTVGSHYTMLEDSDVESCVDVINEFLKFKLSILNDIDIVEKVVKNEIF